MVWNRLRILRKITMATLSSLFPIKRQKEHRRGGFLTDLALANEERARIYSEEYKQGYKWSTNASLNRVTEYSNDCVSRGLEVMVHDIAIYFRNETKFICQDYKAILTREKPVGEGK